MLHIAICDDEKDFVQHLTQHLQQYSKETGQDIKITAYYDGMELIQRYDATIDLKHHLLVPESRQNTEETRQMAQILRSQIADYEDYMHTGNEFLDIILRDKAAKTREKKIDFSAMVDFHTVHFIQPLDISTIFGNALDNAI